MKTIFKSLLVVSALGVAAGCTPAGVTRWNSEAGSQIDDGWFGEATMHNWLAQACGSGGGKGGKTGATVDPLVVLDPASTTTRPIYRVHCDGRLNGKYARVIFNEYVSSAVPAPVFGTDVTSGN